MNDLTVFNRGGQLYTDSRDVAKMVCVGSFFARFQEDNQASLRDSWLSSVAFLFWERYALFSSRLKCFVEPQFLWILGRE